jgi:CHAT domain-containing protein
MHYLDFDLKIERSDQGYRASVLDSPAGQASAPFALPFSDDQLQLLLTRLGRPRGATRGTRLDEIDAAREFGGRLFEAVFHNDIRSCFKSSLSTALRTADTGLRLKLRLQEASKLADLPWEFLFDSSSHRFLAQSDHTPIVRYVEMPESVRPIATALPLRILVAISNPNNYPRLDLDREQAKLNKALKPLRLARKVQVTWLKRPTPQRLQDVLNKGSFHIFHFIGHGGFEKNAEEGVLVLEDEQGRGQPIDSQRLGALFLDHSSLGLAVLNCCEGARNSPADPFASVAATLIRSRVPSVVAMQFEISDEAAIAFAGQFYLSLCNGLPIDASVAGGRKAIFLQPNDLEWGTPVLYMRCANGEIFSVGDRVSDLAESPAGRLRRNIDPRPPQTELKPPAPGPVIDEEDDQKGRWGGKSQKDGRKVEGVLHKEWVRRTIFYFTAIVRSTDGSDLEGPIIFHLHHSFAKTKISISRIRDRTWAALEECSATGVFTVGVQVKTRTGEWTSLELDLAKLKNLPARFLNR